MKLKFIFADLYIIKKTPKKENQKIKSTKKKCTGNRQYWKVI